MTLLGTFSELEASWSSARAADHGGTPTYFTLRCIVDWHSAPRDVADPDLPVDVQELWGAVSKAQLFVDERYGQWGLVLHGRSSAREATSSFRRDRPSDFEVGDLILGSFMGDSDFLMIRCDPSATDFGQVIVAGPLDPRRDWDTVAPSLEEFLSRYAASEGQKYWE